MSAAKRNVIIMGAAGRDFHNFNVHFRDRADARVVAFTAAQIPDIAGRLYPAALAGRRYPKGIPIEAEGRLAELVEKYDVAEVILAYSDLAYAEVMRKSSIANAAGADFRLMGWKSTMLESSKPVVSVCAVRTGCGKSQTTRKVARYLRDMGKRVAVVRHPMPYGDLSRQACQRFAALADLDAERCTIEEREEYEPHINAGTVVFAGVDYEKILRRAEKEADVVLWDGGNNDFPFFRPDLAIVVTDPHRAGHEVAYYPGEATLRMADVVIVNKVNTADGEAVRRVEANVRAVNPKAAIVRAASPVNVSDPSRVRDRRVLVIEDGPTLTHGDMKYGAGHVAARQCGAREIVDPRPYAAGSIQATFGAYRHLTDILPAMGYGKKQISDLEKTINAVPCDTVLVGTPIDLSRILKINKPAVRVTYELAEEGDTLKNRLKAAVSR